MRDGEEAWTPVVRKKRKGRRRKITESSESNSEVDVSHTLTHHFLALGSQSNLLNLNPAARTRCIILRYRR